MNLAMSESACLRGSASAFDRKEDGLIFVEQVEEFEYPDDLSEFQLVSQIELKPKKRETMIFTIEEHRKACTINLSYFIQRYQGQKDSVHRDSLNKNQ